MNGKKKIAWMLALLTAAAMNGCGKTETSSNTPSTPAESTANTTEPGTFPISEELITLRIMVPITASHSKSYGDLEMIQEYEKMANVHVEWEEVASEAYDEKYKLVLASNNLPDAFGAGFSYDGSIIYRYAQEGLIIALEDWIESSTVNMKKYMNEREDFRNLSTYPDGHIYALPSIDENQNIRMNHFLFMNHTFLDALGMEMPTTIDALTEYMRAATSTDLNGDGQKETGLSFASSNPNRITRMFSMFGVSWEPRTYLHYTGEGDFTFAPTMDETRAALEYFHQWYAEGLIDPEIFTQDASQLKAKGTEQGVALGIADTYPQLNSANSEKNEYHIMPPPAMQNGEPGLWYQDGYIPGYSPNQFFITNANEHPAETLRYIDYWMDNGENALTNRFGPKDYGWEYLNEEETVWTTCPTTPTGETTTMETATFTCPYNYAIPYWCFGDLWAQKEVTIDNAIERGNAISDWYIDVSSPALPTIVYEEADNKEAMTIKTDLFKYVDSEVAQFLTNGVTDSSWDAFVKKCGELGADRWTELYSSYYQKMFADS